MQHLGFTKPLSEKTLRQALRDTAAYQRIAADCMLAAVGVFSAQRGEALKRLSTYVPDGCYASVSSEVNDGIREVFWTADNARCRQFVSRIGPCFRAYRTGEGMHYFTA